MTGVRWSVSVLFLLLECRSLCEGSTVTQEITSSEKNICAPLERTRSPDILHLGNGVGLRVLLLEFLWSNLTSSLSSFDFRTYDPEGIIFYGEIDGPGSWFLLALRQRHLEIQMSNEDGEMVLSQWGPNMSDGKWRRVSVDRKENTVEVKVDGELVINLVHYLHAQHMTPNHTQLTVVLGDLMPNSTVHLLRPLHSALDGCMRNWSWVKTEVHTLNNAIETNEYRGCFEYEEEGSYFPGTGYARFAVTDFFKNEDPEDGGPWSLSVEVSFRPLLATGVLFAVKGENDSTAFLFAMDMHERAFTITLFDKKFSKHFPVDFCVGHWQSANLRLLDTLLVLKMTTMQATWNILHDDFKALEGVWNKTTTTIYIGGIPESTRESSYFSGCLKMILQGKQVNLDLATSKHEHIRTHSCPT